MSLIPSRSEALARDAAHDSLYGGALGLLLASGLVASNLDMMQKLADSNTPVASLASLVAVVVAQCAIAASLCGAAYRRFSSPD